MNEQVDIEEAPEAPEKPKKTRKPQVYENTSRENIFTHKGRIAPGGTVEMSATQAKMYAGLTKCQT